MTKTKFINIFILFMVMCTAFSGCLITHRSDTHEISPGQPISRSDLDQIEPGVTTKDWVLDTFGPPTRVRQFKDGSEIIRYERGERTDYEFSLFLIFSTKSSDVKKETLSFEIKDGIVQKYWMD